MTTPKTVSAFAGPSSPIVISGGKPFIIRGRDVFSVGPNQNLIPVSSGQQRLVFTTRRNQGFVSSGQARVRETFFNAVKLSATRPEDKALLADRRLTEIPSTPEEEVAFLVKRPVTPTKEAQVLGPVAPRPTIPSIVGRTVIQDQALAGILGQSGRNVKETYRLGEDTFYNLRNGRVVVFTKHAGQSRFELLPETSGERIKGIQGAEIFLATNPDLAGPDLASEFARERKIAGEKQLNATWKSVAADIGLSLIPIYGTGRDANRLSREWDDLSTGAKIRNSAFLGLSVLGDMTIVLGPAFKIASVTGRSVGKGTVILKATTDSADEAASLINNAAKFSKGRVTPRAEVVAALDQKHLESVVRFSNAIDDKTQVFDIIIPTSRRGIRDAGVVDDILTSQGRITNGIIEIERPMTRAQIDDLVKAIRADTKIESITIRAVNQSELSSSVIDDVVGARVALLEKHGQRVTPNEIAELKKALTVTQGNTSSINDSARTLGRLLEKKPTGRFALAGPGDSTVRKIVTTVEKDAAVPLKSKRLLTKEKQLSLERAKITSDSSPEEIRAISTRIDRLQVEVAELNKAARVRKVETRSVRLEPEAARRNVAPAGAGDDPGGGIAVLTRTGTSRATSLQFGTATRSGASTRIASPLLIADAFARQRRIAVADVEALPSPVETPTGVPTGVPSVAPVAAPVLAPSVAPTPTEVPTPTPVMAGLTVPFEEPAPTPAPAPTPQPQPQLARAKIAVPARVKLTTAKRVKRQLVVKLPSKRETVEIEGQQVPVKGTIAWRQGQLRQGTKLLDSWVVIFPPDRKNNIIFTEQRPIGIRIASGPDSAFKTIAKLGGTIPKTTKQQIGFFSVTISRRKGQRPKLAFRPSAAVRRLRRGEA
ncbi:hypothetical protein LCGC14_0585100 [marine sediment metagenome]|uniref:Uncharacterized protein n=1 Tax=marine sediment metagenome TaxID=412755 RepID=A0A0F9UNE7_9ZZZZ